jgi:hypothetical protein
MKSESHPHGKSKPHGGGDPQKLEPALCDLTSPTTGDLDAWESPPPPKKRPRIASNASNEISPRSCSKRFDILSRTPGLLYDLLGPEIADALIAWAHSVCPSRPCGKEVSGSCGGPRGAEPPALLVSPNNCGEQKGGEHGQD